MLEVKDSVAAAGAAGGCLPRSSLRPRGSARIGLGQSAARGEASCLLVVAQGLSDEAGDHPRPRENEGHGVGRGSDLRRRRPMLRGLFARRSRQDARAGNTNHQSRRAPNASVINHSSHELIGTGDADILVSLRPGHRPTDTYVRRLCVFDSTAIVRAACFISCPPTS